MASIVSLRRRLGRWWSRVSCAPALVLLARCGGDPEPDAGVPDAAPPDAAPPPYRAEVLRTEPYVARGRTFTVTLARVTRPDGGRTYVQWIPSDQPSPRPVVVQTLPYAGIDWTGEELDQRWATYQPQPQTGQYLDVDGPGYDGQVQIIYEPTTVSATSDSAAVHLFNDFSTLFVFGRFYAGGTVRDDIEDMRAGMWFLAEQPGIDRRRIGAIGGSWGGFEALYAASGDPRAPLAVIAALFPAADFVTLDAHMRSREGAALAFMAPYLRRLYATTGGPPEAPGTDYAGLRTADLCATLPRETLLLHDELDNLLPIGQSVDIRATCGADAVYWRRDVAVDPASVSHGPLTSEPAPASMYLYAASYLHLRLATPGQALVERHNPAALTAHLATVRAAQVRGADVSFAAPRLRELCDPRLRIVDVTTGAASSGAAVVAAAVNATWGTAYTEATIGAALAAGLPAP